jgi:hypothetical protein
VVPLAVLLCFTVSCSERMVREASSPIAKYTDENNNQMGSREKQVFVENGNAMKIWLAVGVPTRTTFVDMIRV